MLQASCYATFPPCIFIKSQTGIKAEKHISLLEETPASCPQNDIHSHLVEFPQRLTQFSGGRDPCVLTPLLPEPEGWVRPGGCSSCVHPTLGAPFKRAGSLPPRAQPPRGASASGSLLSRGQVTPGPAAPGSPGSHSSADALRVGGLPGCPSAHTTPQSGRRGFRPSCPHMDLAPRDLVRV